MMISSRFCMQVSCLTKPSPDYEQQKRRSCRTLSEPRAKRALASGESARWPGGLAGHKMICDSGLGFRA